MTAPGLTGGSGAHAGQKLLRTGPSPEAATGALILVHGRGADAAGMLDLGRVLVGADVACLAPQAAGHVWYPHRFIEPLANNEPYLSSALSVLADLVAGLVAAGLPAGQISLAGFSQGACLSLEFARRFGGVGCVLGFSGGLIGETVAFRPAARLNAVPVLLGCSDHDPHIPAGRVRESAELLNGLGAAVTTHLYPGISHSVTREEIALARKLLPFGSVPNQ